MSESEGNIVADFFEEQNPERRVRILVEHLQPIAALLQHEYNGQLARFRPLLTMLLEHDKDPQMMLLVFLAFLNVTPAMKDYVCNASVNRRPIPFAKRQAFFDALGKTWIMYSSRQIARDRFFGLLYQVLRTGAPLETVLESPTIIKQEDRAYDDAPVGQVEQ